VLGEFEKRLRREWAIETGIIEDVYTLDRGVTRILIEKGIDAALIPHGTARSDYFFFIGAGRPNFASSIGTFVLTSSSTIESRPSSHT
jgi:hypothetical protein